MSNTRESVAAVGIQTLWRGYRARKQFMDTKKLLVKRTHAAREILSTEQSYCRVLDLIVSRYLIPIGEQGFLTKKNTTAIFSNVDDIRMINKELLEALEGRMMKWSDTARVGDVFSKLVPFLKLYTVYCSNYNGALTLLERKREAKSNFAQFLDRTREDIGLNMPLPSLLIQPVQRIPRYRLLFAELLKSTPEDHVDYPLVQKALVSIEEIAVIVNESIREAEYLNSLIELKKRFVGGVPDLVVPKRYLVREGPLQKVCRKDTKQRIFFLFNDMIMYAVTMETPTPSGNLKFHRALPLQYTSVVDTPDRGPTNKFAFQLLSKEKSFTVLASTQEEKASWLVDIHKTKAGTSTAAATGAAAAGPGGAAGTGDLGDDEGTDIGGAGSSGNASSVDAHAPAPVWVPDKDRKNCMICDMKFTTLKRRHHCRRCGTLCCGACSNYKAHLPNIGKTCRVCFSCYEQVTGKKVEKKPSTSQSMSNLLGGSRGNRATREVSRAPPGIVNPRLPPEPAPALTPDDADYSSGSDFFESDDELWTQPDRIPPRPPS